MTDDRDRDATIPEDLPDALAASAQSVAESAGVSLEEREEDETSQSRASKFRDRLGL